MAAPQEDRSQKERHSNEPRADRRDRDGFKPKGGKPQGKFDRNDRTPRDASRDNKPKSFEARPPRAEKPIDPDNPFAVLAALRNKI